MLLKLGRLKEAGEVYKELIERNAENWYYYEGLEKALQPSKLSYTDTVKIFMIWDTLFGMVLLQIRKFYLTENHIPCDLKLYVICSFLFEMFTEKLVCMKIPVPSIYLLRTKGGIYYDAYMKNIALPLVNLETNG